MNKLEQCNLFFELLISKTSILVWCVAKSWITHQLTNPLANFLAQNGEKEKVGTHLIIQLLDGYSDHWPPCSILCGNYSWLCNVQYLRIFNMLCQTFCYFILVISRETNSMTSRPSMTTGSTSPLRWRRRLQNRLGGRAALTTVTEAFQGGKSFRENNLPKNEL